MADRKELVAKIRQETYEHVTDISLSSTSIKAQKVFLKKFDQKSKCQTSENKFIIVSIYQLEKEIKLDEEQTIKNLQTSLSTIQSSSVRMRKDLLLKKEVHSEMKERIQNEIQKYEEQWAAAKEKYENIPLIKKRLEIMDKINANNGNTSINLNECNELEKKINQRRHELISLDREIAAKLAQFFAVERPMLLKTLAENKLDIKKQIDSSKQVVQENKNAPINPVTKINYEPVNASDSTESRPKNNAVLLLPSIHLQSFDIDDLNARLDQIKKVQSIREKELTQSPTVQGPIEIINTRGSFNDIGTSSYFNVVVTKSDNTDYSNKKLIHILKDVRLSKYDIQDVLTNVKASSLQTVNVIASKDISIRVADTKAPTIGFDCTKRAAGRLSQPTPIETEEIEEVDLTSPKSVLLLPPTQFMDTQDTKLEMFKNASQSGILKEAASYKSLSQEKKVSFDLKEPQEENMEVDSSVPNTSALSIDSYTNMKEMMLKKNFDLSPVFVYSKNILEKKPNENIVTSKFFEPKQKQIAEDSDMNKDIQSEIIDKDMHNISELMKLVDPIPSTSKDDAEAISGFLFNHGEHGLMQSLDMSCTDNANGESECPHAIGIDSSLLMSPKADDVQIDKNEEKHSVFTNFFTGLRKTGFSIFGGGSGNQSEDTNSGNQGNNFNFTFDSEPKKRADFFNMFN